MNHTQKQMVAAVNYIDDSWATDDAAADKPDRVLDDSNTTDDGPDFREGEESA